MAGGLAVALSGGGAKGAFQVGVLHELIVRHGVDFETVVGTSTGAIQAAGVAQNDLDGLLGFWTSIRENDNIYKRRGGTLWAVLTGKSSLYDTSPLRALLRQAFTDARIRATGKRLRIAVVNITNAELRIIGENADTITDWIYASCAMPAYFPPLETRDRGGLTEQWVDGGVRDVTPFDAALAERPRAVLVVRAGARPQGEIPKRYDSLIDIGLRSAAINSREVSENDLKNVNLINRLLTAEADQRRLLEATGMAPDQIVRVMRPLHAEIERFRMVPTLVIEPETDLYDTLEFKPDLIARNIDRGRAAVNARWGEIARFLGVEA
jgi:NTE family protein